MFLALCAAGSPAAGFDDGAVQAPDGSFPEHGSCTFIGRQASDLLFGAAADAAAAQQRTRQTQQVLASIPKYPLAVRRLQQKPASAATTSGPCAGIDDCIRRAAAAAGVPLAGRTTDTEFLRRVRLDLTGRIPSPQEILDFQADASEDKRARLVDRLLQTPEWADRWAMFLGDLLRNTRLTAQVNRYRDGRDSLHLFLLESMRANKPYDQLARELLAATGFSDGREYPARYTSFEQFQQVYGNRVANPIRASAVGYVVGGRTTGGPIQDTYDTLAFFTARDFLGISLMDCVLCHDGAGHLDELSLWGAAALRAEGWSLAAFFSDVPRFQTWRPNRRELPVNPETGRNVQANYYKIEDLPLGARRVANSGDTAGDYLAQTQGGNRPDRTNPERFVEPAYPFTSRFSGPPGTRLRVQLGQHLTSDPQFARAAANYVWREFFSRGIVEPPDQFDLLRQDPAAPPPAPWEVQPSHPELLDWLGEQFRANGFDLKWLMREIAVSDTYQLSSRYEGAFNPLHEKYFVRYQAKRLSAEAVHDAIMLASGRHNTYNISPSIRRLRFAMQFPDVVEVPPGQGVQARNARAFLSSFTPGDREETARSAEGSPLQALNLMNHPFVVIRLNASAANRTMRAALELADDGLVTSLYLHTLGRQPSAEELGDAVAYLQGGRRPARAANLQWALFNKSDFYFNY